MCARIVGWSCCLILAAAGFVTCADTTDDAELAKKVHGLIRQLDDPDHKAKAETELLKLGAKALPFLDDQEARTAEQKTMLRSIRNRLRQARAALVFEPKRITLAENEIPLRKAIEEVAKATGNPLVDRRQMGEDDVKIRLNLKDATFWQAVDAIAKEADLAVSVNEDDGKVALRDGPYLEIPTSYHGLFRCQVTRVIAVQELANARHACGAQILIAWEPKFHPLVLQTEPESLVVENDKGVALDLPESEAESLSVDSRLATIHELRFQAPPRAVPRLGRLKGSMTLIGPSKMLTFKFQDLGKIDRKDPKQTISLTQEGVTIKLRQLKMEDEMLTASLLLEYPEDGPDFESLESWLVDNRIFLKAKNKKHKHTADGGYDIAEMTSNKAFVTYRFVETDTLVFEDFDYKNWELIYESPAAFIRIPLEFDFKDIPLP